MDCAPFDTPARWCVRTFTWLITLSCSLKHTNTHTHSRARTHTQALVAAGLSAPGRDYDAVLKAAIRSDDKARPRRPNNASKMCIVCY